MKKQNSKLFAKFEDAKILNETAKKVNGGVSASISATAEDHCTRIGETYDCTDTDYPNTNGSSDSTMTTKEYDSCGQ